MKKKTRIRKRKTYKGKTLYIVHPPTGFENDLTINYYSIKFYFNQQL